MPDNYNLNRFLEAQENTYQTALAEIRNGRKRSHWMWFIFPQVAGLGFSETSQFYGIKTIAEATAYLNHPVLGKRLEEITEALLTIDGKTANQIFGSPDDMKLKSSMTLFAAVSDEKPVFRKVLEKYFNGQEDTKTLQLLKGN
ncbi:DUF1810 domain-containing protein [Pontibacter sp. BT310]|uniref:DUF1810 domain-containing protein n=1 Tax=Pontibacter populi TaxID=890055 RepID=A0ABS6XBJ6_9BACT|nr:MULTISPECIES: DUF1810 domain-containing protein [Pontibacter]MBJ6118511.1 DUF1810 domain-containing protein [Pontibacter sp. BT310]MBR0570940.1 DUF1810 domain-containing protein [Microvirga sp. STS03]MBW3365365.1 DUF1810 domain-containing protein [Pontibacter populi]